LVNYARRLVLTDLIVVILAVGGAQVIWFGFDGADLALGRRTQVVVAYTLVSIVIAALWLATLKLYGTRDARVIGSGSTEYKRIVDATFWLFGVFAIVAYLAKIELARGYFLTALPFGFVLLVMSRWLWRQWLHRRRSAGEFTSSVLLIGSRAKVAHVAESIRKERSAGLTVVAVLIPRGRAGETFAGAPVLGDFSSIVSALEESGAKTIVLTDSDDLPHSAIRTLSWDLESRGVSLIVVPALTDVAGPRIHARPVSGLPLIHVEFPVFEGRRHVVKRAFDIVFAAFALALLSPLFLLITILIRTDSPGRAFFVQERVGLNGAPFTMLKFRSMSDDAEEQLASLLDQSDGSGVLFKLKQDPRVTRIGRFLRRHSLDELPQFINVLRGEMSLVGPRPPLVSEVAQYDDATRRRLLVKPGVTGLWQVSGRSNLSWEDSVRLDLFYVENWSLTGDLVLLYRTVRAVLKPHGAY
jgi:exopolysaccharide biosynthesis polyprenyl glycosylphosphotransferase